MEQALVLLFGALIINYLRNYKMYKLIVNSNGETNIVQRLSDNAFIPMDIQNTDYISYLKWVEAGNQPLPADIATETTNA